MYINTTLLGGQAGTESAPSREPRGVSVCANRPLPGQKPLCCKCLWGSRTFWFVRLFVLFYLFGVEKEKQTIFPRDYYFRFTGGETEAQRV